MIQHQHQQYQNHHQYGGLSMSPHSMSSMPVPVVPCKPQQQHQGSSSSKGSLFGSSSRSTTGGRGKISNSKEQSAEEEFVIVQNGCRSRGGPVHHQFIPRVFGTMSKKPSFNPQLTNCNNNNSTNNTMSSTASNSRQYSNNGGNGSIRSHCSGLYEDQQNFPPQSQNGNPNEISQIQPPPLPPRRISSLSLAGTQPRNMSISTNSAPLRHRNVELNQKRISIATSTFWEGNPEMSAFVSGWEVGRPSTDKFETQSVWGSEHCASTETLDVWGDPPAVKKGLLLIQRERLWSRWKERYCILTRDYFNCFRRSSAHSSGVRLSELGSFIFKLRLADVEEIEWETKRSGSFISLVLPQESRILIRVLSGNDEALHQWYTLLQECVYLSKERRRALKIQHISNTNSSGSGLNTCSSSSMSISKKSQGSPSASSNSNSRNSTGSGDTNGGSHENKSTLSSLESGDGRGGRDMAMSLTNLTNINTNVVHRRPQQPDLMSMSNGHHIVKPSSRERPSSLLFGLGLNFNFGSGSGSKNKKNKLLNDLSLGSRQRSSIAAIQIHSNTNSKINPIANSSNNDLYSSSTRLSGQNQNQNPLLDDSELLKQGQIEDIPGGESSINSAKNQKTREKTLEEFMRRTNDTYNSNLNLNSIDSRSGNSKKNANHGHGGGIRSSIALPINHSKYIPEELYSNRYYSSNLNLQKEQKSSHGGSWFNLTKLQSSPKREKNNFQPTPHLINPNSIHFKNNNQQQQQQPSTYSKSVVYSPSRHNSEFIFRKC